MNDPLYCFYIRCKSTSLLLSQLSFDITPYNGGHIYYTYIIHILKYCTFSDQKNNICVKQTTICFYDKAYYNTTISYNTYTMIFHLIFSTIQIYSFHCFKHNTTFIQLWGCDKVQFPIWAFFYPNHHLVGIRGGSRHFLRNK